MQLRVRTIALSLVVGGLLHRLGGFASPFLARPLACCVHCGAVLTLGLRFRLGLCLSASHGGLNPRQTILAPRQLGGPCIPSPAPQGRVLCRVLLGGLGHQGLNVLAQALDFLLHRPRTHRLVTRRIALDFRAIRRHVASLHQPRRPCQTDHLHKYVLQHLQMERAKIADRAKVWTVLPYNGDEGEVALAGQGDLAARKHPHTVGIEQEADHHGWVKRRRATGFLLIGGVEALQAQLGHDIEQEEDSIALRQLGRWAMRFLPIALRLPGAIRFPTGLTHHCSPSVWVAEASYAERGIIACDLPYGNYGPTSVPDRFVDSLLEKRLPPAARSWCAAADDHEGAGRRS